MLELIWLQSII